MKLRRFLAKPSVLTGLLVLQCLSVYRILFSVWMLSHPLYESAEWLRWLLLHIALSVVVGVAIMVGIIARLRRPKQNIPGALGQNLKST